MELDTIRSIIKCPKSYRLGLLSLNYEAKKRFCSTAYNPLLDPYFCGAFVEHLHRHNNIDISYGGYLESRRFLWRESYLEYPDFIHLGVDINAPANTELWVPKNYKVVDIFHDHDQNGGWGDRLTLEIEGKYIVFAHILIYLVIKVGKSYTVEQPIGRIAMPQFNGGWYPHLHLQGLKSLDLLEKLDGYGPEKSDNSTNYPYPFTIL